uniref:Protein kinase domain-containing protein n=1 Tax=Zooxanthella nutricula TaxID=1333877 RepID=A0A7S2PE27_9DINO
MTDARVRFIVDWVLRCLADHTIRGLPEYFERQFLHGLGHDDTSIGESGLLLSGAVAHGLFGNIWLHARESRAPPRADSASSGPDTSRLLSARGGKGARSRRQSMAGSRRQSNVLASPRMSSVHVSASPRMSVVNSGLLGSRKYSIAGGPLDVLRMQHVVISVSKVWCRLPPELLSARIQHMISMEPIPFVLPLRDAFEDSEHVHLVYDGLSAQAVCLTDKVFDDMHLSEEDADEHGFCEKTVQQIVWKLLKSLEQAHSRGMVHGSLRMGCCYFNDPEDLDSLQILEFGLAALFDCPTAVPPAMILSPLEADRTDPVPAYRRDFQCLAEMAFLMLGGQPICSLNSSKEELAKRFRRGAVNFSDKSYAHTTEDAKDFVVDVLRPACFRKNTKLQPCYEVSVYMSHRWFYARRDNPDQLTLLYDVIVMRKYDTWRNTLRLRCNFMKILADHMPLKSIGHLCEDLAKLSATISEEPGAVSWTMVVNHILKTCPILHLLQKVNKAFGENEEMPVINIRDTRQAIEAWRRKRVREIVWQVFNRSKAYNGEMQADACWEGFHNGVLHVWSRPLRVVDIVFPPGGEESDARQRELQAFLKSRKRVRFLELLSKTDAARPI